MYYLLLAARAISVEARFMLPSKTSVIKLWTMFALALMRLMFGIHDFSHQFHCMYWLASKSLISKFSLVKSYMWQGCVQVKKPRKPDKDAEERNLVPLELIHSYPREMDGVYTKGGKIYFMTFIDGSTRYCYAYLQKTKDEVLSTSKSTRLKLK